MTRRREISRGAVRGVGRAAPLLVLLALLAAMPASAAAQEGGGERIVPFETTAQDGTALRGDVYLPDRPGRLGVVLNFSPYWNSANSGDGESQRQSPEVAPFVDAGFAVALVNVRGTGESEGCFEFGSRVDWRDTATVVEALADEPYSNGNVGMYGTSYEGWTQFMGLAAAPPSLKAIVPTSGIIDVWSLLTRQGAPISVAPVTALAVFGLTSLATTAEPSEVSHVACAGAFAEHQAASDELIRTGDRTAYWQQRDLRPAIAGSRVPTLLSHGLDYFSEAHELQFEGLWDLLGGDRRFILGQWGHGGKREDFEDLAVGWFDHYLRGGPQTTKPGVAEFQDDAGDWHTADRWPPRARATSVYLSGEHLVARRPDVEPGSRSFQSADADTAADAADGADVTVDDSDEEIRNTGPVCGPHQVLYLSPPLAADALVAGNFDVDLSLTSSEPGGNLVATLYHAAGDGSCAELLRSAKDSGRVQLDLRHWRGSQPSRDFPVGSPTEVRAASMPLATRIPAGDRLVLAIGAGSAEILPDPLKPQIAIDTGSLTLPVVGGRLRFASVG